MIRLNRLFLANETWAKETRERYPDFFDRLARGQVPDILWVGCSDSRVPAERITNSQLGELFVHRNIANQALADATESTGVLEYAVKVLKVRHIIVCGHTHCGGVRAALQPPADDLPLLDHHIAALRHLADRHRAELNDIADFERRADRLAELNVVDQVERLVSADIIRQAADRPCIHGWLFNLRDGRLRCLSDGAAARLDDLPPAPAIRRLFL